jgi:hypothetical protein
MVNGRVWLNTDYQKLAVQSLRTSVENLYLRRIEKIVGCRWLFKDYCDRSGSAKHINKKSVTKLYGPENAKMMLDDKVLHLGQRIVQLEDKTKKRASPFLFINHLTAFQRLTLVDLHERVVKVNSDDDIGRFLKVLSPLVESLYKSYEEAFGNASLPSEMPSEPPFETPSGPPSFKLPSLYPQPVMLPSTAEHNVPNPADWYSVPLPTGWYTPISSPATVWIPSCKDNPVAYPNRLVGDADNSVARANCVFVEPILYTGNICRGVCD